MKTLIAFGILLLAGFVGSTRLFTRIRVSTPFSYLFYSGTIYIFFGLIIGENGFNLISSEIVHHLAPVINFSLGWVGFIFGFQLELRFLKRISRHWYFLLITIYLFSFLALFFISLISIKYLFSRIIPNTFVAIGISLVFSILISESSVSFISLSSKFFKKFTYELRLCTFISSLENFFPILLSGIVLSLYRFIPDSNSILINEFTLVLFDLGMQIVLGLISALFIHFILKRIEQRLEISVVLFGTVLLVSGLSFMFHFSPLFVTMVAGAVFANITRKHGNFLKILIPTEKPIYIIFLIFLAIKKMEINIPLFILAFLLLLAKFHAKFFVFKFLNSIKPKQFPASGGFSYLFIPVSSVAPAIFLDLFYGFPHHRVSFVLGVFVMALVLSEIFAPVGIRMVQKNLNDN